MDKLLSLGIDPWSILLYLVNTGVLLAVLSYFLYQPVLNFLDERRKRVADSLQEAERLRRNFEQKMEESELERERVEAELRDELTKLRKFTDEKRAELIAEMEAARATMMQKAQDEIDAKKASLVSDVEEELMGFMVKAILHIVENKVPEDVIESSVKAAWKDYAKS